MERGRKSGFTHSRGPGEVIIWDDDEQDCFNAFVCFECLWGKSSRSSVFTDLLCSFSCLLGKFHHLVLRL